MAFDFQKAINGEPIYCDGERIHIVYLPTPKVFYVQNEYDSLLGKWDKYGIIQTGNKFKDNLSTDPPKKKVNVTAYVYKDDNGQIAFAREKILREWKFLGEISGEVEI